MDTSSCLEILTNSRVVEVKAAGNLNRENLSFIKLTLLLIEL